VGFQRVQLAQLMPFRSACGSHIHHNRFPEFPVFNRHPRSVRRWLLFIALLHWLIFIILLLQGLAKHTRNRRAHRPASPYVQVI
jgi:hypothetical protein